MMKADKEKALTSKKINTNLNNMKWKLSRGQSRLSDALRIGLEPISTSDLSWKDPLASGVISDDSDLVRNLPSEIQEDFMEPSRRMIPRQGLSIIRKTCRSFIRNFDRDQMENSARKLKHDGSWKENKEVLAEVATNILNTLNDVWNNPAFDLDFEGSLNEGTYLTSIIVPSIRSALKNLPFAKTAFVSTSEKKCLASTDRKGNGRKGRRPDIMFEFKYKDKNYELMYVECSRLSCTKRKEQDDMIKLWRECNDGLYWTRKGCKPEKEQFGIVGVQIAGRKMHLNVLTRGKDEIHRYYHLHSADIPVRPVGEYDLTKTLLILRNIIIVNLSLLHRAPQSKSRRQMESSSTVFSP